MCSYLPPTALVEPPLRAAAGEEETSSVFPDKTKVATGLGGSYLFHPASASDAQDTVFASVCFDLHERIIPVCFDPGPVPPPRGRPT